MKARNTGDGNDEVEEKEEEKGERHKRAKWAEIRKLTNSLKSAMKEREKDLLLNFIICKDSKTLIHYIKQLPLDEERKPSTCCDFVEHS